MASNIPTKAEEQIAAYTRNGFDKLPMCMAKTHLSISHDPTLKGAPDGLHRARARNSRQRRRRLPLPAAGHDEHDARPADTAGLL